MWRRWPNLGQELEAAKDARLVRLEARGSAGLRSSIQSGRCVFRKRREPARGEIMCGPRGRASCSVEGGAVLPTCVRRRTLVARARASAASGQSEMKGSVGGRTRAGAQACAPPGHGAGSDRVGRWRGGRTDEGQRLGLEFWARVEEAVAVFEERKQAWREGGAQGTSPTTGGVRDGGVRQR